MFEMTEQELSLYGEKKRVLKEFSEMFFSDVASDYCRPVGSRVYEKFTLKEVVSDDFLYSFYPYMKKYTGTAIYGIFQRFHTKKLFDLTKEESDQLLPLLIDLFADYTEGILFTSAIAIFKGVMNNNISNEKLIELLFEHDYFKKSRTSTRSDYVLSFINDIVGKSKFDDAEKLIKTIQNNFPDYHNFPIIIMNKNITKEEKIKALKLIYRKKDFPQYKHYFRDNLIDLDDLDTFIEATIIQNNRVREKEDNLIKLFKDIFISGEWRENLFKNKTYLHLKEFSKKYSQYFFNPNFTKKFYNENVSSLSTNNYYRQEQYESLIQAIFSGLTTDEKIDAMVKSKELECLGKNFSATFKETLDSGTDDELCRKLISVFETWSKNKKERFFEEIGRNNIEIVFKKFGKDLTFVKELKLFDYSGSVDNLISSILDEPGYSSCYSVDDSIVKSLFNDDVFDNVKFFDQDDWSCLGFNYKKAKDRLSRKNRHGWNDSTPQNMFIPIEMCMKSFFSNVKRISESDNYNLMEKIIERFLVDFELGADILSENAMEIYNDEKLKSYKSNSGYYRNRFNLGGKTQVVESVKEVIEAAISAATKIYTRLSEVKPEYSNRLEILKENLSDAKGTIELICAI